MFVKVYSKMVTRFDRVTRASIDTTSILGHSNLHATIVILWSIK